MKKMESGENIEGETSVLMERKSHFIVDAEGGSRVISNDKGRKKRIAVMASGRGTDFQSLIDANKKGHLRCKITILICNNKDAGAIDRAKLNSIPVEIIDHRGKSRIEFDREVDEILTKSNVDLIVLAGFMRVLSSWFVSKWRDRIVNIHPALLPSFPGTNAHKDALEYGVKITGLTIHLVDEKVDHGPIIFQHPVEVMDNDTEETLSKRVLKQEHIWYPRVVQWLLDGRVKRVGRRIIIDRHP